jgi:oxaloacetate decarboxylase alpha subunit/pyruvate carboxylase subunit B
MLLRGQNIVQYTSFPDDVVQAFIKATAAAGQDVFRIFDALNDLRNLKTSIETVISCGKQARGEICYTTSPVHTVESFVEMGIQLERLGCHSIGIKDMSGLLTPKIAYDIVSELKRKVGIPLILHTHDTAGMGASAYLAAIEAGVDTVETSIAPFANGTGQPDTLRMLALLEGHPRCPEYDRTALHQLRVYFEDVYQQLKLFTSPANERVDSDILTFQVPGGMLSNFRNQLAEQGMAERFKEVLEEIPVVRQALGWIPLVTPTSQIVGTQAMMNVKFGRWKVICQPVQDIALGKFGKAPGPILPEILKKAEEQTGTKAITVRPADLLMPKMADYRDQCKGKGLPTTDEIVTLFAMFPMQIEELIHQGSYLKKPASSNELETEKPAPKLELPTDITRTSNPRSKEMTLRINGKLHHITVEHMS